MSDETLIIDPQTGEVLTDHDLSVDEQLLHEQSPEEESVEEHQYLSLSHGKQSGRQDSSQGRQWYAIHTYSGYEDAVQKSILTRIETFHMQEKVFEVVVPKESEIHLRKGKPVSRKKCIFPGYVLVEMIVTDDSWYLVRNTPNVTGFVGSGNIPVAVTPEEFGIIKGRMGEEKPKFKNEYSEGDVVKITAGPFATFEGKVTSVNVEKGRLTVSVVVFDRETPVELGFNEVSKS